MTETPLLLCVGGASCLRQISVVRYLTIVLRWYGGGSSRPQPVYTYIISLFIYSFMDFSIGCSTTLCKCLSPVYYIYISARVVMLKMASGWNAFIHLLTVNKKKTVYMWVPALSFFCPCHFRASDTAGDLEPCSLPLSRKWKVSDCACSDVFYCSDDMFVLLSL